jgi:hypothetical protein
MATAQVFSMILGVAGVCLTAAQLRVMLRPSSADSRGEKRLKLLRRWWFWHAVRIFSILLIAVPFGSLLLTSKLGESATPAEGSTDEVGSIDEADVRQIVRDSQIRQFLDFYSDPNHVVPRSLDAYWASGSTARSDVEAEWKYLLRQGWHYGSGSKMMRFEFRYVRIFSPDYAEVGTVEQWYLPMVHRDGSRVRQRNADLGPYQIDYTLRRIRGSWLVESSTALYIHKKNSSP